MSKKLSLIQKYTKTKNDFPIFFSKTKPKNWDKKKFIYNLNYLKMQSFKGREQKLQKSIFDTTEATNLQTCSSKTVSKCFILYIFHVI